MTMQPPETMTDKATMPEEVWIGRRSRSDGGLWWDRGGRVVTSYTLTEKYDSLAAVAGRMAEALEKAGIDLHESEKNAVLSSYNALMKGR